jgi:hypothetical protein
VLLFCSDCVKWHQSGKSYFNAKQHSSFAIKEGKPLKWIYCVYTKHTFNPKLVVKRHQLILSDQQLVCYSNPVILWPPPEVNHPWFGTDSNLGQVRPQSPSSETTLRLVLPTNSFTPARCHWATGCQPSPPSLTQWDDVTHWHVPNWQM